MGRFERGDEVKSDEWVWDTYEGRTFFALAPAMDDVGVFFATKSAPASQSVPNNSMGSLGVKPPHG